MGISSMHGWGWGWAAVISAVGVCGCVRVVQRRAVGWGTAAQAYLSPAAPSSAGSAHPHARATTKILPLQTPQSAAALAPGGGHTPTRCCERGGTHLCLRVRRILVGSVFLAPGTAGQRPQATRPANAAGFFAAWPRAWEGWGRVGVREEGSEEAMGGGKERVRGKE